MFQQQFQYEIQQQNIQKSKASLDDLDRQTMHSKGTINLGTNPFMDTIQSPNCSSIQEMFVNKEDIYLYNQELRIPLNNALQSQQVSFLKPMNITNKSFSAQKTTTQNPTIPLQKKNLKNFLNKLNRQEPDNESNENDFTMQDSITDENPNIEYKVQELNNNQTSNFTKFETFKNKQDTSYKKISQQSIKCIQPINKVPQAIQETVYCDSRVDQVLEMANNQIKVSHSNQNQNMIQSLNLIEKTDPSKPQYNQAISSQFIVKAPLNQVNQNIYQNQLTITNQPLQCITRQSIQNVSNLPIQQVQNQANQNICVNPIQNQNYQSFQIQSASNLQRQPYQSIPAQIEKENNMTSSLHQKNNQTTLKYSPVSQVILSQQKNNFYEDLYKSLAQENKSQIHATEKQIQSINQIELQKSQYNLQQSQNCMNKSQNQTTLNTNDQPQSPIKLIGQKGYTVEGGIITGNSPILVQSENGSSFSNSYTFTQNNFISHSKNCSVPFINNTSSQKLQQFSHLNQQQIQNEKQLQLETQQLQIQKEQEQLQQEYLQLQQKQQYLQKEQEQLQIEQSKLQNESMLFNIQVNQQQAQQQQKEGNQPVLQNNFYQKRSYSIGNIGQSKIDISSQQYKIDSNIEKYDQIIKQKPICSYFNTEKLNTLNSFKIKQITQTEDDKSIKNNNNTFHSSNNLKEVQTQQIEKQQNELDFNSFTKIINPIASQYMVRSNSTIISRLSNKDNFNSDTQKLIQNLKPKFIPSLSNSLSIVNRSQTNLSNNNIMSLQNNNSQFLNNSLSNNNSYNGISMKQTDQMENPINKIKNKSKLISQQKLYNSIIPSSSSFENKTTLQNCGIPSKGSMNFKSMVSSLLQSEEENLKYTKNTNQINDQPYVAVSTNTIQLQGETNPSLQTAMSMMLTNTLPNQIKNNQQNLTYVNQNNQSLQSTQIGKKYMFNPQNQQIQVQSFQINKPMYNSHTFTQTDTPNIPGKGDIQKFNIIPVNRSPLKEKNVRFQSCQKYSSNFVNQMTDKPTLKSNNVNQKQIPTSGLNRINSQNNFKQNKGMDIGQQNNIALQKNTLKKSFNNYNNRNNSAHSQEKKFHPTQHDSPVKSVQACSLFNIHKNSVSNIQHDLNTFKSASSNNTNSSINRNPLQIQNQKQDLIRTQNILQENIIPISQQVNSKQIQEQQYVIQQTPISYINKLHSNGLKSDCENQQNFIQINQNPQSMLNGSQALHDNKISINLQIDKRGKPPQQSIDIINNKKDMMQSKIQYMRNNQRSQSITNLGGNITNLN